MQTYTIKIERYNEGDMATPVAITGITCQTDIRLEDDVAEWIKEEVDVNAHIARDGYDNTGGSDTTCQLS